MRNFKKARSVEKNWLRSVSACALIAAATAFAPNAASAQAAAQSADAPAADSGDILVTAQRKSESVQKVPIAVTAISVERVEALNLKDVQALQLVTPGLQFNTGINYAQTYIRGVGFFNTAPGVETSVATYIDGAYLERGFGSIYDVVDPASMQVIKGPQGTLWGRNATGGAILITTADPEFSTGGKVSGEIGDQGHRLGEAAVNAALSDTVALRVAGRYREDGGYVRNLPDGTLLGGRENWTLRGKLLFQPSSDFTAVAQVQIDRAKRSQGVNSQFLPASLCLACGFSTYTFPLSDRFTTVNNIINGGVGGRDKSQFYNLQMRYNAGDVSLTSVTAFRQTYNFETGDFDFTEARVFNIAQFSGAKTFTQDLTANFDLSDKIQAIAGLAYLDDRSYIQLDIFGTDALPPSHLLDNTVGTTSISGFGEVTAELATGLKLTGGARYTHDKRTSINQSIAFNKVTTRAVLAYETGDLNLYASFNQGYKAGGFNTPSGTPLNIFRPETINSYEIGAKYVSPDRKLRLSVAAFHYDRGDLQVLALNQSNVNNISQTLNAAARGNGFELEVDYKPVDAFQFFGGLSHLDAQFTKFPSATVQYPVGPNGLPTGVPTGTADLSGSRLPMGPALTVFGGITLKAPLGAWKGELTGFVRYSSSFDFTAGAGGPFKTDVQPSFATVKLSGQVVSPDDRYSIGFFIENLTNTRYFDFRYTTAPFGGLQYPARPRSFGIKLGAKFGA